jgi:hypothetical protein
MANLAHGLRSTYNAGCRCHPCREAERQYKRRLRGSTWEQPTRIANRTNPGLLPPLDPYPTDPWKETAA